MVKSQQCHYRIKNIYVKSLPIRLKRKNYEMHAKWIKIRIISLIIMNKLLSKLFKNKKKINNLNKNKWKINFIISFNYNIFSLFSPFSFQFTFLE